MRVNIYLLILVLGYKAAAGIIHEIVEEKTQVSLRCPHSVEGDVMWSRERNGDKTDILTVNGGSEIKHIPGSRYGSLTDKSLFIVKAVVSDSGRYFCNNEAAADLTVIPSGTTLVPAPERTSITLTCPHDVGASHVPTWTRDSGGIPLRRFDDSPVDQTLTITDVQPGDSGLYYCDGKPAVYLNVIKGNMAPRTTTTTTTTTTTRTNPTTPTTTTSTTATTTRTTTTTPTTATTRQTSAALPPTEAEVTTVPSTPPRTDKDTTITKKQKNKKKKGKKTTTTRTNPTTATTTPTTTTATATTGNTTETPYPWQMCVRTVIGILYLIIMISITVTTWRKARQTEATHSRNRK